MTIKILKGKEMTHHQLHKIQKRRGVLLTIKNRRLQTWRQ